VDWRAGGISKPEFLRMLDSSNVAQRIEPVIPSGIRRASRVLGVTRFDEEETHPESSVGQKEPMQIRKSLDLRAIHPRRDLSKVGFQRTGGRTPVHQKRHRTGNQSRLGRLAVQRSEDWLFFDCRASRSISVRTRAKEKGSRVEMADLGLDLA